MLAVTLLASFALGTVISAQENLNPPIPNTFPHDYPGKPSGGFSPEWQNYFEVATALPNVTFRLPRSFAGNIPVNRAGHPNDTLFFWAFESTNGSLTASAGENIDKPWAIWLNGGPGSASTQGLLSENGPLLVTETGGMKANNYSWNQLVDYVWVDQPVGVGYSTADSTGYVADEDQMGEDFVGFLSNIVKVFPSLAERPFFITGESYAGTYIPYIMKAIFSSASPPVRLAKAAIGDGTFSSDIDSAAPALNIIATYPQIISYDPAVYDYFLEQTHLCGADFNLTYPQTGGKFPTFALNQTTGFPLSDTGNGPTSDVSGVARNRAFGKRKSSALTRMAKRAIEADSAPLGRRGPRSVRAERKREEQLTALVNKHIGRHLQSRDLNGRANGTIDPWYGCFLTDELYDYAVNFSLPWSLAGPEQGYDETPRGAASEFAPFDPYYVPDARKPPVFVDGTTFMNDPITRAALHAPTSMNWSTDIDYPFGSTFDFPANVSFFGDPSPPPSAFMDELAANMSAANVSFVVYSGNDDTIVAHFASEVTIQNTTFGGTQGFTKKPQTPFTDDDGNFLGIVHQERNWTYILVDHAGHEVPEYTPLSASIMFREFILGTNQTGLVQSDGSVVGGENQSLYVGGIIPGQANILAGSGTATSFYLAPSATVEAWNEFYSSVLAVDNSAAPTQSA